MLAGLLLAAGISIAMLSAVPVHGDEVAQAPATQPATQPTDETPSQRLDAAFSATITKAITDRTFELSEVKGGAFGKQPFQDHCPNGVLIGFRIGLGRFFQNPVVKYIQPIYLTPDGEEAGPGFGSNSKLKDIFVTIAPPGYAVGGLEIRGGGGLDAVKVTYMAFNGTRLDPSQRMVSEQFGGAGGHASILDGNGTPIIGIHGVIDDKKDFLGLGVIFSKHTARVTRQ